MGFPIHLAIRQGNDHNYMLCIIALIASTFSTFSRVQIFNLTLHSLVEKVGLYFLACFFASCGWIETVVLKKHQCERRVDCKKHDRKKQRRVDCAEAIKKTVQAMRYEGRGFFIAGDCLAELPVIILQALSDRFLYEILVVKECSTCIS